MPGSNPNMNRADRCRAALWVLALALPGPALGAGTPEPGLIEFLGTWETDDGQWIDPIGLLDARELDGPDDPKRESPPTRSGKRTDDRKDRHERDEDED